METLLQDPPTDGISALNFSPADPNKLVCSSWDGSVRLYDTVSGSLQCRYQHAAPALDCAISGDGMLFSSGCDNNVLQFDPVKQAQFQLPFQHTEPVKCLALGEQQLVYSAAWDRRLQAVDLRQGKMTFDAELPARAYSMSLQGNILAVAMAERLIDLYDVRTGMKQPYQRRVSSLKFQTRCIRLFPHGPKAYAISSIEGRVAVEYVDPSPQEQAKKFAFKCHRQRSTSTLPDGDDSAAAPVDIVYPVHAIAMHPVHETFATGGGDGIVNTWDPLKRKRIRQYPRYETSVSALAFNCTGQQMAVAVSYAFEQGYRDHAVDNIHIKTVVESDVQPKRS